MNVLIEVLLISALLAIVIVVITRVFTDPKKLKDAKQEMAFFKDKVNAAQKEGNTEEVKRNTNMMMTASKKQFKYSMKSTMVSMVVVLIAFYLLGTTYQGVDPKITDSIGNFSYGGETFPVKVDNSSYLIDFDNNGFDESDSHKFGEAAKYKDTRWGFDSNSKTFTLLIAESPVNIPFIGRYLTWFWLYILVTIPITFIFRKLLGVD